MPTYQSDPLATDPYSRMMVEAFDDREFIGASTAFQAFFARGTGYTRFSPTASVVEIDIVRGNEKTAALIPRGMISRPLGDTQRNTSATKYTTFSRRFPLSLEEGNISADQLEFRGLGENPYGPGNHLTRTRALALEHHQEQVRRTVRLFERLAAQAILTGKQDAILGGGADLQYDFKRLATHTVTAGASWLTANTDIMGDVRSGCELIRADAHVMPDIMILGETAMRGVLVNTALKAFADNRRIRLFEVNEGDPMPAKYQPFVDGGMIFRGWFEVDTGFKLAMFTYLDTYETNAGTVTKFITDQQCLIGSTAARCDRYFGPPERLPLSPNEQADMAFFMGINDQGMLPPNIRGGVGVVSPAMFSFDFYKSGRNVFTVTTQSAPIFAPVMTDAFYTLDVVP